MTLRFVDDRDAYASPSGQAQDPSRQPSVAIVIPTRNDAGSIDHLLGRVVFATTREAFEVEILVVDRGSNDGTRDRVEGWMEDFPVRLLEIGGSGSITPSILEEELPGAEVVVFFPPDLSYGSESISAMVGQLVEGTSDVVVGIRHGTKPSPSAGPWWHRSLGRAGSVLGRALLGSADPLSRFFAYRSEIFTGRKEASFGPAHSLDLTTTGVDESRVCELPVRYEPQRHQERLRPAQTAISATSQLLRMLLGGQVSDELGTWVRVLGLSWGIDFVLTGVLSKLVSKPLVAQLIGLLAASMVVGFGVRRSRSMTVRGSESVRFVGRIVTVVVMALLFRGVLFEALIGPHGSLSALATMSMAGATWLIVLLGMALFALQEPRDDHRRGQRRVVFALFVVGYSLAIRLVFAAVLPLIKEESYYWNYGRHLSLSYFDHPPLSGWMIALSSALFGHSELAVRLPAELSWVIATVFLFGLAWNLADRLVAAQTAVLMSILPIFFGFGLFVTPDSPLLAAWAGCLFFLERALRGRRSGSWIGFGVCLGLGILSKYSILLILPAIVLYLCFDRSSRRWAHWRQISGALLIAGLLATPVLVWNYQHHWVSFLYQGPARWTGEWDFGFIHLVLACAVALTPFGLVALLQSLRPGFRWSDGLRVGMRPPDDHGWLFAVVFTVIPLSVFVLNSLIKVPKVNWTGPAWLAAVPLVALTWDMGGTSNGRRGRTGRPWWSPNSRGYALTLTLVLVSLLAWRLVGAPGLSDELRGEIRPWTEIGPAVGDLRTRIGREMSSEPIVVGMDTSEITSQLSFYDPLATKSNTAGWHLLGKWSEGFRYWQDPDQVLGRNLIMVSFDKPELEDPSLQGHFDDLGPLSEIEVAGGSELTTKIYYRIGFSYLGL